MKRLQTDTYEGLLAETVVIRGHDGISIRAFFARPQGPGPYPGVILIPHILGWDEWFREITLKFAQYGFLAICPNIFHEFGNGAPDDVAAKARTEGGLSDDHVVGDALGALEFTKALAQSNGKVGIFGTCSGGRHAFLVSCRIKGLNACIDITGGRIVMAKEDLTAKIPVAPIDYTKDLSCPLLGLFGEEDKSPTPEQVAQHEQELKKYGKNYEFHMYQKAGHGFLYYDRPMYRQEQAVDGWNKIFAFLDKHLSA